MNYHTTTRIWLHLEDYHNSGITPERSKELIEMVDDPVSGGKLRCQPMGLNNNWIVETHATEVGTLVYAIETLLKRELRRIPSE